MLDRCGGNRGLFRGLDGLFEGSVSFDTGYLFGSMGACEQSI